MHRCYLIEELATGYQVAFLLIEGELPTASQLARFNGEIHANWMVRICMWYDVYFYVYVYV
jgi:hypothetical protein